MNFFNFFFYPNEETHHRLCFLPLMRSYVVIVTLKESPPFFFFFFFEFEKLLGNCFNYFETLTGLGKGNNDGRLKEGSKKIFLSNVI